MGQKQPFSIGALLIHGFTATPASVAILEDPLKAMGLPVSMPLLRGHGASSPEMLRGVTFQEWLADATESYRQLALQVRKVVIVGHSMGALLALQLAARFPETIDSLLLAAPALRLRSPLSPGRPLNFISTPLSRIVKRWNLKPVFTSQDHLDCAGLYAWAPTDAILSLFELIRSTVPVLARVRVPLLVLQNRHETTIHPESVVMLCRLAGAGEKEKTVVLLEHSEHQIFCDGERELAMQAVLAFISQRLPAISSPS